MIALYLIAGYVVFSVLLWAATWVVYLADCATHWADERTKGTTSEKLARYINKFAIVMSTLLNVLVFTVILLELPKESLLSTRLSRHKRQGKGWRQKLATYLGRIWLDPFDPSGEHI